MPKEQAHPVLESGESSGEKITHLSPEALQKKALAAQAGFPKMDQAQLTEEFAQLRHAWERIDEDWPTQPH